MVGPFGVVVSLFQPTSRIEGRDHTTTLKRPDVGAVHRLTSSFWLPRTRAYPARHFRHYFFHFWPLVQTLGRGLTVGSPWSSSTPLSLGKGRVAPSPYFYKKRGNLQVLGDFAKSPRKILPRNPLIFSKGSQKNLIPLVFLRTPCFSQQFKSNKIIF